MSDTIQIFCPGDYRPTPNKLAEPQVEAATQQIERALDRLGRKHKRIPGMLTRPHEAIERLSTVDDPIIGIYAHWVYGPHTTDGVAGKDNPLLLASNFSGQWPGLVGLLNTGACLEMIDRAASRIWSDAADWRDDEPFMQRLEAWTANGAISYDETSLRAPPRPSAQAQAIANTIAAGMKRRRPLAMMLGDTSMGMTNGYFGPRLLSKVGFAEHKVDQAWIIERGKTIAQTRIDDAYRFVVDRGVEFHYSAPGAEDFNEAATREQLRDYLAVLDLAAEFKADCIGWQYQLGLIGSRPPSDFAEGLLNSTCRPESNGDTIIDSTEADQGNLLPMEMMKRILKARGLHQSVFFHDIRWGEEVDRRFVWLLLNSGSSGAYAFNHDPDTLKGVHCYRQPSAYFPIPGGTFAGESLPGQITWARAYVRRGELWMDVGRGEVLALAPETRDRWWNSTTREWPFMAADLGMSRDTLMAHYLSNHVAVAYGDILGEMVALSEALGYRVRFVSDKAS
ncbi:fucose isomerase [Vitreimonas flagellata]|jgi:L-fucose isomerase-like protein|uniref:fucose isomerase n=1 Tax=Vitreimonas flagellata TaxID=2560861 RepID=UPI0010753A08|nr:fucose isomerase [Vitreimonas flagellata]